MSKQTEQHDISQFVPEGKLSETILRLARYALVYRRQLAIALLLLVVAVGTELTGPFVAKRIIDKHITGIEQAWYATPEAGPFTVSYDGALYKRADHFAEGEARSGEVHILQVGLNYYFINGSIAFDGERSIADEAAGAATGAAAGEKRLTIAKGDRTATYSARELSLNELFGFFHPEFAGLLRLCLFYFGLVVVSAFFTYGQKYMLQTTANRIVKIIRDDTFNHLSRLAVRYFDNLPAGKVVSRITNDTETIRELYVNVLANFFTGIIYMVSIFVALFLLYAKVAAICLFIVPLLFVWIFLYRKFSKTYNRIIRSTVSEINGVVNESIQGMPIIQAFAKEPQIADEFETHNSKLFRFRNKILSLNSLTEHNLVGVIRNCAFVALIWYFGGATLTGLSDAVTLGMLYAFVDYINRLFNPIVGIVNQLPKLEIALVSAERVFILLDEPGENVADERVGRFAGNVRFEDVRFGYAEGEDVLHGISFDAKPGQTVALVGHTGSGKSSVLSLLFRFYDADRGRITIDGVDVRDIPRQAMREHMGIVLQDPFLFTGTIASNVSLDHPEITREQINRALNDVGAGRLIEQLPQGIDEPVIEKGSTLSAGQRQLISFARALAFDPAILILDEATSHIDTETESLIQNALDVVKQGRTTFIIAHRLSTVRSADQILVMDQGRIIERGDHESLLSLGGKYHEMYRLQLGGLTA